MPKAPKGLKDLKMRWWKGTLADLKRLRLPEPDHAYGFSQKVLEANLSSKEFEAFNKWMYGQTMMLDEKLGPIVYTHDVIRGVDLIRNRIPTYFD